MRHESGKFETAFQIYLYWHSECAMKVEKMIDRAAEEQLLFTVREQQREIPSAALL